MVGFLPVSFCCGWYDIGFWVLTLVCGCGCASSSGFGFDSCGAVDFLGSLIFGLVGVFWVYFGFGVSMVVFMMFEVDRFVYDSWCE